MGAISRTGTTYTCGAHEVTHGFSVVRFTRSLVLCLMFCRDQEKGHHFVGIKY
jgi:hypothetical protein